MRGWGIVVLSLSSLLVAGCGGGWDWHAGSIHGRVTDAWGLGLAGVHVYTLPVTSGWMGYTDSAGYYDISGIPSGTYVVVAGDRVTRSLAYSSAVAYVYGSHVRVDLEMPNTPFSDIEGSNVLVCAANVNTGGTATSGLYLMSDRGWQEVFPLVGNGWGWVYGKPDYNPVVDGEIVFSAGFPGNREIYRFNVLTGDLRQLTSNSWDDKDPAFGPDGNTLVWAADRDLNGYYELYRGDVWGSSVRRIVSDYDGGTGVWWDNGQPAWTAVPIYNGWWGGTIAFSTYASDGASWHVAIVAAEGESTSPGIRLQTAALGTDSPSPTWHPSATQPFGGSSGAYTLVYVDHDFTSGRKRLHYLFSDVDDDTVQGLERLAYSYTRADLVPWADCDDLEPAFARTVGWLSFVSVDAAGGAGDQLMVSYSYTYGTPDSLGSVLQWTFSAGGNVIADPCFPGF